MKNYPKTLIAVTFGAITFFPSQLLSEEVGVTVASLQQTEIAQPVPTGTYVLDSSTPVTRYLNTAAIPAGQERWVNLGRFRPGGAFRVSVTSNGHSANSSAICEFSAGNNYFTTHRISLMRQQSTFDFHYKKHAHNEHAVFLRYSNTTGGSNYLHISIDMDRPDRWLLPVDPGLNDYLTETTKMNALIHTERSFAPWSSVPTLPFFTGVKINQLLTATAVQVDGSTTMKGEAIVEGNTTLGDEETDITTINGKVILEQIQGDIPAGIYGSN